MTRVVFDTNILYSAILKPDSTPAKAFNLVLDGLVIPCVSDDVLAEYRLVLYRPELDLHAHRRRELLGHISALSLHVAPTERLTISKDDADNRIYECAAAADADYIVTGNAKHFKETFGNTGIVNARELLAIVGEAMEEEQE